jgi:transposase
MRFEADPGHQMQVDFDHRKVWLGAKQVTVHFLVAVLGYSRRILVKLNPRPRGNGRF